MNKTLDPPRLTAVDRADMRYFNHDLPHSEEQLRTHYSHFEILPNGIKLHSLKRKPGEKTHKQWLNPHLVTLPKNHLQTWT
ncbi:TPA: hypothetical protein HA318_01005 [Candidatus Micrarchaeota archaeon]|nr:MAG: hypothetical protein AUJ65_03340 [Candidatus Micrarchaeota archaeon CG1_02_51_15]HII38565.1 hypothetical protein [Candidatus Micrarchaeota archaeon]